MDGHRSRINRIVTRLPYRSITFDCYGTLVDWRRGMRESLATLPTLHGHEERFAELKSARMEAEQELERGDYLPYAEVLALSLRAACKMVLGLDLPAVEARRFADAQSRWPAFDDSVPALRRLAPLARLAVLSNSDREPLRTTSAEVLGGLVEPLVSAEDVRSYKPAQRHFEEALHRLECAPGEVLHVSAYPYYDLHPAHALGMPIAYVDRDPSQKPPEDIPLAASCADLAALADALGA